MFKTKKQIIITASFILGTVLALIVYFGLIMSGAINLLQKNLIFTSGSKEIEYVPDTTIICHEYTLESGTLYYGHYAEVTYFSSLSTVGSVLNDFTVTIYDSNDNVVTSKYDITLVPGTLSMRGIPIKIQTGSASKMYDSQPLENGEWGILSGGLFDGHEIEINMISSRDVVGVSDNDFNMVVFDADGVDVTHYYALQKELGILEVTPKTISITTGASIMEYDGTTLKNSNYSVSSQVIDGHQLYLKTTGEIDIIGTAINTIEWRVDDANGVDVSSNYLPSVTYGELEIVQKNISVFTVDLEKIYDGVELSIDLFDDLHVSVAGLLINHKYSIVNYNRLKNVGTLENRVTLQIFDANDNDVTYNYKVNEFFGTLEVTTKTISYETCSVTKVYDGLPLFNSQLIMDESVLATGHNYSIKSYTSETYVGSYKNYVSIEIVDADGIDVTKNYEISSIYGTLTIFAREITITSQSFNFVYSGYEYIVNDISNNVLGGTGNILEEDIFSVYFYGSITYVGSIYNIPTIIFENVDSELNYNITYECGIINVLKQTVYVQTGSNSYLHDDLEHSYEYATIRSDFFNGVIEEDFENYLLKIDNFVVVKNLGTYYNTADIKLFDTQNFELVVIWGGLTIYDEGKELIVISPINITVGVVNFTVNADGFYETNNNLNGLEALLERGYTYKATVSGSISGIGFSSIEIVSFTLYDPSGNINCEMSTLEGIIISEDFTFQIKTGVIAMSDITITAWSESIVKVYDGTPLNAYDGYYFINGDENLPTGYIALIVGQITNVGTITPMLKIYDIAGDDVTHYYNVDANLGQLTIEKVNITFDFGDIIADEYQNLNDLNAIPNYTMYEFIGSITVEFAGTAGGPESFVNISASNTSIRIFDSNGNDITTNFNIKYSGSVRVD